MPAARTFRLLAIHTLLLIAGVAEPALVWTALALDLLVALAVVVDHQRAARTPLECRREVPRFLSQAAAVEIRYVASTSAARPVTVRLRDGLSPALADAPARWQWALDPGTSSRWRLSVTPFVRGEHVWESLDARVLGPWQLAWAQRELIAARPIRVYPQVRWGGRVGRLLGLAQRRQLGQSPTRHRGEGAELYSLREASPGDPLRKIHWRASARHGRLYARENAWERGGRLIVLLDCGRAMTAAQGRRDKLDYALAAALALTRLAIGRGDHVTLLAFAGGVVRTQRVRPGGRSLERAYRSFYDLEARLAEPAYDVAVEAALATEPRRGTAVMMTSVVDLAAADLLRDALLRLDRRHATLLVNLEDPELDALARSTPQRPEDAFAQVAALDILLANRRLGRRLRRSGVRTVSAIADELALGTLDAYLDVHRSRARSAV